MKPEDNQGLSNKAPSSSFRKHVGRNMSYSLYDMWDDLRETEEYDQMLSTISTYQRTDLIRAFAIDLLKASAGDNPELGAVLGEFADAIRDCYDDEMVCQFKVKKPFVCYEYDDTLNLEEINKNV